MTKWSGFCDPRYQAGSLCERCVKTRVCDVMFSLTIATWRYYPGPGTRSAHGGCSGRNHYLRRFCDYLHFIASNDRPGGWEHYVKWSSRGRSVWSWSYSETHIIMICDLPARDWDIHIMCVDIDGAWWHAAWHMRRARETGTRSQINLDNVVQSKVCDSYTTPATDLWLTLFTPSSREFYNSSKHSITQITLSSHSFDICPIKVKQFSRSWPGRC